MMRLLLLCLLLPTATAYSEDRDDLNDVSGDGPDDEDLYSTTNNAPGSLDKTRGEDNESDQMTLIVIVVAVVVLALSIGAVIAYVVVRRRMNKQQQGIYTVPIDQDKKEAV